ncbi:PREDICTED: sperm flagellar protein 1 [Nipponia nippon]|uniref:sperm flagellar protein 1 n=1 Tax=Nipponia nippon TaxID=128390 RepID=UPI0005108700|nr:PREDICTED: sperm flagellar protein 1 [Nipponia nippon]
MVPASRGVLAAHPETWLVPLVPLRQGEMPVMMVFGRLLAAEVVKFFFPAMVQLHSYVPASSTPQKLANWGHLNRKALSKLNFSIPEEVIRQVVQCRPGAVEQVLLLLRQKIEEKQKQSKAVTGPGQEPGLRAALEEVSYLETGCSKAKSGAGGGYAQESPRAAGVKKSRHGCAQAPPGDADVCLQLAEREQALLLAQETIQILRLKVGRLEQGWLHPRVPVEQEPGVAGSRHGLLVLPLLLPCLRPSLPGLRRSAEAPEDGLLPVPLKFRARTTAAGTHGYG